MPSTVTNRLQGITTSVAVKPPCITVATSNIALSGLQTVGSVALVDGDRVLVAGQDSAAENGIYEASTGLWARVPDFDGDLDAVSGTRVLIRNGGVDGIEYELTTPDPIVIGTTGLTFQRRYGANATYDEIEAEISSGVDVVNSSSAPFYYDVRRVGVVANDSGSASSNTTALTSLLDPDATGITGTVIFPNTTGADIYYFDGMIEVRDRITLDLCGSTLNFSKTYESSDNTMGFLTFIRNVTVRNGRIVVDYDGSSGSNAGLAIRIGSRSGYGFGAATSGLFDSDLASPMGNIKLQDLEIETNNPSTCVLMLGGLRNVLVENVSIDGQDAATVGIYYEFGFATDEATTNQRQSSHACNMRFRNIRIENIDTDGSNSVAFGLTGAYNCDIDGLYVNVARSALQLIPGEALYYRPWADQDDFEDHWLKAKNVVAKGITSTAITLTGATASTGYLSGLSLGDEHETDLAMFSLDGFDLDTPGGNGIAASGPVEIRNGTVVGAQSAIVLTDECTQFTIENVRAFDCSSIGFRLNFGQNLWPSARMKTGAIRGCFIAGCGTSAAGTLSAIGLGNCDGVIVENNRFGYSATHDGLTEDSQAQAVAVSANGSGVICRNNYVAATNGGAVAYALVGTGPRGCRIENPRGEVISSSGNWGIDGIAGSFTGTNIADDGHAVNTTNKYFGKLIYDSSNQRVMMALGSATTDGWRVVDGSATVTPS